MVVVPLVQQNFSQNFENAVDPVSAKIALVLPEMPLWVWHTADFVQLDNTVPNRRFPDTVVEA